MRFAPHKLLRTGCFLLGGSLLTLLSGCKLSDALSLSGPQSTFDTAGPVAKTQLDLFMVTVWVTTFIFVIVGAVLAYATIKFKAKDQNAEKAETPPQGHGNPFVEMGLIVASVALLVIIAIPTLKGIWYTHDVPEEERANALDITATGYQWWFKFEYATEQTIGADGKPGANLVTGNELVVPVGTPVRVHLRTVDVIHSFWIPKLAGKVDMIPNRANHLWFKADKAGYYYGQCAEYCGDSHAIMRFRVIALDKDAYAAWLSNQKHPARVVTATAGATADKAKVEFASLPTGPGSTLAGSEKFDANPFAAWQEKQQVPAGENAALIAKGRQLFKDKTCISCHTVRGHEGVGIAGPELTHVGARSSIAAGVLENSPERMHQWISQPDYFKPGNKMFFGGYMVQNDNGKGWKRNIEFKDGDVDAIVAYLQSLK